MDKKINLTAGVSLVEIMIGMLLIAIALVTITAVFPRMNTHGRAIHEVDQARILATTVLEGIQMLTEDTDYPGCNNFTTDLTFKPHFDALIERFDGKEVGVVTYTIPSPTITCATAGATVPINTVAVTVQFTTPAGKAHSVSVSGAIR
jgi:Tfp pilus assembly protein PilV